MPSTVSALHQRGQKLYQKGDFKAAIEVFGEALNQKDVDAIGVLDNRAATFSKLEQFDQARRDARHMIKNAKEDERGYMRCAKILLLEGKPDKALEIYAYGLKMLPSQHPRRGMLEQLHDKLLDRMMLNRRDPFTILPLEIAAMVIQDFSFKQIVAIMRVCKSWDRFFTSMTNLWMKIDLTGARSKVPWTAVRSYIKRSKAMLTHAIVRNLATKSTPKSLDFLSRCPRLEHLELWVSAEGKDVYEKFKGSKQLRSLTLSPDISIPHDFFGKLLIQLPRLERIALWNVKHSTAQFFQSGQWPKTLANLKSVTLASDSPFPGNQYMHALSVPGLDLVCYTHLLSFTSHTDIDKQTEPCQYPNLQELRLDWDPPIFQPISFPLMASENGQIPPLRRLELRGAALPADFYEKLPISLEYLHLRESPASEFDLDIYDKKLRSLHTLILNDCRWVSMDALTTFLICSEAPIRTLRIEECFSMQAEQIAFVLEYGFIHNAELKNLTELGLVHVGGVDDGVARRLCTMFCKLKVLDLTRTHITGITIRMFADVRASGSTDAASLDYLIVRCCDNISSDAVAYGRERGLQLIT